MTEEHSEANTSLKMKDPFRNNTLMRSEPSPHFIRRLAYIKGLYMHGVDHLLIGSDLDSALALLNFDNTIEMLMFVTLENLMIPSKARHFDALLNDFKRISEKLPNINPQELIHETEVMNMHLARNNVQHCGIVPSYGDLERFRALTEAIMIDVMKTIFHLDFNDVSLALLIRDEFVKKLYTEAESAFQLAKYDEALVYCAAAFETAKIREQSEMFGSGLLLKWRGKEDELIDLLVEEIEILKLRLDYKKYQKYCEIFLFGLKPFTMLKGSFSRDSAEIIKEIRTKIEKAIEVWKKLDPSEMREKARSCMSFVLESVLKWESVSRKGWLEIVEELFKLLRTGREETSSR